MVRELLDYDPHRNLAAGSVNFYGVGYRAGLHAAELILADATSTTAARRRIAQLLALADVLQEAKPEGETTARGIHDRRALGWPPKAGSHPPVCRAESSWVGMVPDGAPRTSYE
jgi:hypothetical protein